MHDYLTARAHLSTLLGELHLAPELLLHKETHEHLLALIATYTSRYAAHSGKLETQGDTLTRLPVPQSSSKAIHRASTPEPTPAPPAHPGPLTPERAPQLVDHAPQAPSQEPEGPEELEEPEEPDDDLQEVSMPGTPHRVNQAEAPAARSGGLSASTLVMVDLLPNLFEALGEGLDDAHLIIRIERLEHWSTLQAHLTLDVARRRELAHYLIARMRSVQDPLGHHDASTYM
jgi:hypothetical protein